MSSEACNTVLVTGGAGYIGSHTVVELYSAGYNAVIVDNLSNSSVESIKRIEKITGKQIPFHKVDVCNKDEFCEVFTKHKIDHVIHFAGLKAVGESCEKPMMYYQNNLISTMTLVEVMREYGVRNLVFSSSCTVYGQPQSLPINEAQPVGNCTNPYGRTSLRRCWQISAGQKTNGI